MNARSTHQSELLLESVLDAVIEAGFNPMNDLVVELLGQDLEDANAVIRQAEVLGYFAERGWEAFRPEADGTTLVRWSPDGLEILAVTVNGATAASARFDATVKGVAWFTAAIA